VLKILNFKLIINVLMSIFVNGQELKTAVSNVKILHFVGDAVFVILIYAHLAALQSIAKPVVQTVIV
jgi:hypothetical protein